MISLVLVAGLAAAAGCSSSKSTTSARPANSAASQHQLEQARAQDRAAQSDLRNALTAEKTVYVDNEKYDATAANMRDVEPSLDWGGRLKVSVGDAVSAGDAAVVCISESSAAGKTSSIGDVALGPLAGTYYGTTTCPAEPTPKSLAAFGSGCTPSKPGTTVACFSSW